MIKLGDMGERVRIERAARTQRADGGWDTGAPTVLGTVWAKVLPVRASEAEIAGRKRQGSATYLVTIRNRSDIREDDTLVWITSAGNVPLNIRELRLPVGRSLFMDLLAESGVPQ